MNKEFIPYEQALALKELGFDDNCFMIYYNGTSELRGSSHFLYSRDIKAPLYQQAFRWFREKYNLGGWAVPSYSDKGRLYNYMIEDTIDINPMQLLFDYDDSIDYPTKEEAEIECLKKLIEIVKLK